MKTKLIQRLVSSWTKPKINLYVDKRIPRYPTTILLSNVSCTFYTNPLGNTGILIKCHTVLCASQMAPYGPWSKVVNQVPFGMHTESMPILLEVQSPEQVTEEVGGCPRDGPLVIWGEEHPQKRRQTDHTNDMATVINLTGNISSHDKECYQIPCGSIL